MIAGIVIGAVAAGAAAYLLLTEKGAELRSEIGAQLDKLLGREPTLSADTHEDPQAYLHHKSKAPKTDRDALKKHDILHEGGHEEHPEEHHN